MKQWYYKVNDEKRGPFSLEELKAAAITKQTLVRNDNMTDWEEAGNIENLKALLFEAPSNETMQIIKATPEMITFFSNRIIASFFVIGFYLIWIACNLKGVSNSWTNFISVLQTIATIYLLYGLKNYLNELDRHKKSDYIIYSTISLLLISAVMTLLPENNSVILSIIFLFISGTLSLLFMINLMKIKNDFSGSIKRYGYFQFFCWLGTFLFFLLAYGAVVNESMSIAERFYLFQIMLAISTLIRAVPVLILALLFIKTRKLLSEMKA